MALRVWLPLNGNLNNQGLSSCTITNSGATIDTGGKIGKTYLFDANDDFISIDSADMRNIFKGGSNPFTIAFWVYNTKTTGNRAVPFGDYGLSGTVGFNLEINSSAGNWNNDIRFYWNGNPDYRATGTELTTNAWVHLVITYDGGKVDFYRNGILVNTRNGTLNTLNKTSGAFYLGRDNRTGGTAFGGKINDFRVYDECLSQKQIKEISKCLVAHYKLDSQFRSNRNITLGYYGTTTNSGWGAHRGTATYTEEENNSGLPFKKVTKFVVTYDTSLGSGGGTSVYPPSRYDVLGNTQYTYSTYVKAEDNFSYLNANFLYRYEYNSAGTNLIEGGICSRDRMQYIGNGWYRVWGTFTTKTDTVKIALPFYTYCSKNNVYYLGGQQLELGGTMTPYIDNTYSLLENEPDSSGYGYNGTQSGTLSYNSDSPRYESSTTFTSALVNSSAGTILANSKDFTINGWFYHVSGTNYYASAESYNTSVCLENGRFFVYPASGSAYVGTWSATNNVWQMLTLVHDGVAKTLTLYVNGSQRAQVATNGTIYLNNTLNIGGRQNTAGYNGSISDFRIYATALSADDILTMYKNSGIIDNKGNVYAYEFKEE